MSTAHVNNAEIQTAHAAVQETFERYQSSDYAAQYKREYTGGLSLKHIRSRVVAAREITVLRNMLTAIGTEGGTVLDIPCGTGKLGSLLAEFPLDVVAADVSPEMMNLARNEYCADRFRGFLECDARQIPRDDQSVDIVLCLRLFQRLPAETRREILQEFHRLTRRHLLVSYSYTSPAQKARRAVRTFYARDFGAGFHENLKVIRGEIEACGFRIHEMRHVLYGLCSEVIVRAERR